MKSVTSISKRLGLCIVLLVPARAFAFDVDELRDMIRDRALTTVAEVIAHLPVEYRENYTLAYDSRSLQGSSRDNPRAILFGRTARLVLSFNGDPAQQHYDTIEAMQFREPRNTFELYAIDFADSQVRFSGPNPPVCAGCHGSPPRPIWSSYEYSDRETGHWPGFYGSTHDAPALEPGEKAAFERFRQRAATHHRYRHLVLVKPNAHWFPYGTGPTQHALRPNNRLGNLLARWHARQIVALINRGGFIERHPRVAQAWLLQCPGTEGGSYRARVQALFDTRFPPDGHRRVHALLDKLPAGRRVSFMMERLLSDSDSFGWDMSIEAPAAGGRFDTGIATIDRLVGARWMATLDDGHRLTDYYEPWSSRELYNTFADGYYESNVRPGGVGEAYDAVARYYDESRARLACPAIMRSAPAAVSSD